MNKMCVFPGTFNPFHKGHKFVINRALKDGFNDIIVLISQNENKPYTDMSFVYKHVFLSLKKYIDAGLVRVLVNNGRTADFINQHKISYIIRGYRDDEDLEFEKWLFKEYRKYCPHLKCILYKSPPELKNFRSSNFTTNIDNRTKNITSNLKQTKNNIR